ncbi:MAG: DUF438 domain-containing protein, partial [Bacteroidales bacterium]|nr:DUF438 domain-containing protein [Bacteroidales bacterium]
MSDFTHHQKHRVKILLELTQALLKKEKIGVLYKKYSLDIDKLIPSDIITAVDELMKQKLDIQELKTAINKLLNLVFKPINDFDSSKPKKNTLLWYFTENNTKAADLLTQAGVFLKKINKEPSLEVKENLISAYQSLLPFMQLYTIKENTIFPLLEDKWDNYRCVQLMWAFHDDIRKDLKHIIELLSETDIDMMRINRLAGDISFRIMAIKFRDEKILFPEILDTIDEAIISQLLGESLDLEYPYVKPEKKHKVIKENTISNQLVDLDTGAILPEQIKLIFNHLPVDITYVDENNKVKYYSTPKHRIFPRTNAVLGRDVHNCHPPDSVHIVERIVEELRNGTKDKASFWIHMGPQFILIQYFAV